MPDAKDYLIKVLETPADEKADRMLALREQFLAEVAGKPQPLPQITPVDQRQRLQQKLNEIGWKIFRVPLESSRKKLLKLSQERLQPYPELWQQRQHLLRVCELCSRWDSFKKLPGMHYPFLTWVEEWLALPPHEAGIVIHRFLYNSDQTAEKVQTFQKSARLLQEKVDSSWTQLREQLAQIIGFNYWQSMQRSAPTPVSTPVPINEQSIPGWVYILIFSLLFKVIQIFLTT